MKHERGLNSVGRFSLWHLADRSQFVPQGSVPGPIVYLLYTSLLGDVIRRHFYADESQVYFSFDSISSVTVLRIEG